MRSFSTTAAQGEITIRRIGDVKTKALPNGFKPLAPEGGKIIVGHSETGHHHVMAAQDVTACVMERESEGMRILRLIVEQPTALEHLRPHDTHEPIMLVPGEYEVRIGREYDPYEQIARRQAD